MASRLRQYGPHAWTFVKNSIKWTAGFWVFSEVVGGPVMCGGWSMYPSMPHTAEWYLEDRLTLRRYGAAGLRRGDIVTAAKPTDSIWVAKRIIGLPGDVVLIDPLDVARGHFLVPKGHVWLAGDNASNSNDSRNYGPVPIGLLKGHLRAQLTDTSASWWLWPVSGIKLYRNPMKSVLEVDQYGRMR
ncbi:LexA/Signal peptidase [Exidia glandulosa HHB12029]|uniref:LexA/Signal peptidase n=1 Tax=Exidia glandulosa HHB12029 TaxID=1314781 RepID=A0A165QLY0_EXIGL|nr:LexA/Signal peptidase [Exidia glandulosa HHB12029]